MMDICSVCNISGLRIFSPHFGHEIRDQAGNFIPLWWFLGRKMALIAPLFYKPTVYVTVTICRSSQQVTRCQYRFAYEDT
jgi:hypothetical protein